MHRQSQALEMAPEATDVNHVGIGGLTFRSWISGTVSTLTSTVPRRTRPFPEGLGLFPGSKTTEVLSFIGIKSSLSKAYSRSCPTSHSSRSG